MSLCVIRCDVKISRFTVSSQQIFGSAVWDVWGQGRAIRGHPVCDRAAFPRLWSGNRMVQLDAINQALRRVDTGMALSHQPMACPTAWWVPAAVWALPMCTDCNAKSASKEACELENTMIPAWAWETNCLEFWIESAQGHAKIKKQNLTTYQQFLSNSVQKLSRWSWGTLKNFKVPKVKTD